MRDTLRHLGYKSTLHYLEAMCELVLRETSLLPHPQPRPAQRGVDCPSGRGLAQHGTDARKRQLRPPRAWRGAYNAPISSGEAPAHYRRGRKAASSLHHGPTDRDRRNARRPRGYSAGHCAIYTTVTATSRNNCPELSRQAHDPDG